MTNPWSDAAATNSSAALRLEPSSPSRSTTSPRTTGCRLSTLRSLVKAWLLLDFFAGLSCLVYALLLHKRGAMVFLIVIGSLWWTRAVAGWMSISSDLFHRYGLLYSAHVSPILVLVYVILCACSLLGGHGKGWIVAYLEINQQELHLPRPLVNWLVQHHHALVVAFIILIKAELVRWVFVKRLHTQLISVDTQLLEAESPRPRTSSCSRPWWWSSSSKRRRQQDEDDLQDPLLPHWTSAHYDRSYTIRDETFPPPETSFWSRIFFHNTDEEEVDFESVREEWASRSQADPYWWTKDENERDESCMGSRGTERD